MEILQLLIMALSVTFIGAVDSKEAVQCYYWKDTPSISLSCPQDTVIQITNISHSITRQNHSSFCQAPYQDDRHCFERYNVSEVGIQKCNGQQSCQSGVAFLQLENCKRLGFSGDRYLVVKYNCQPSQAEGKPIPVVDMTHPLTGSSHSTVYLRSSSYPDMTRSKLMCHVTLAPDTLLRVTVLDLYGMYDQSTFPNTQCAYHLVVTDNGTWYSDCANQSFKTNLIHTFKTSTVNSNVLVSFQSNPVHGNPQAKLWIKLNSLTLGQWPKDGIKQINCDPNLPLWTTTVTQTTVTTTTSVTTTTTQAPPTSTTNNTVTLTVEESSGLPIMPIIAGAVAGGLVIIVLLIIFVVLMVRRHYMRIRPAKHLEVIDAWDNQSALSGSQHIEPYDMSRSLPVTYPANGRPSFVANDNGEIYSELQPVERVGVPNLGYQGDEYYTGDIDKRQDPVIPKLNHTYAQPMKKPKKSGFEDPEWLNNGSLDSGYDGEKYSEKEVYGYSTTLG